MKHRRKRVSSSPLIDPEVCCLVLIVPDEQSFAWISPAGRTSLERNLVALTTAADIVDVPVFVSSQVPRPYALAEQLASGAGHRHFPGAHAFPWLNPEFVAALAQEDRTALLIAGLWLEYQVLATALHGLAEAYDVYLLLDATPARAQPAVQPSHNRLMFAGATPVITSQVIHEWYLEANDATRRAALNSLLVSLLEDQGCADRGLGATP